MDATRLALTTLVLMAISVAVFGCGLSTSTDGQSENFQVDDANSQTTLPTNVNQVDMRRKIDVVASIESFDEEGWRDHFEEGGYAAYQISELRIIKPVEYEGKWLNVRLEELPDSNSIWRNRGMVIKFRIAEEILEMAAGERAFVGESFVEAVDIEEQ